MSKNNTFDSHSRIYSITEHIANKVTNSNRQRQSKLVNYLGIIETRDHHNEDLVKRKITDDRLVNVIIPKLDEIPLFTFTRSSSGTWTSNTTFIRDNSSQYWDIQTSQNDNLRVGGIIYNFIDVGTDRYDKSTDQVLTLWTLQLKEQIVNLGQSHILAEKFRCTTLDVEGILPDKIINNILERYYQRIKIGY